MLQVDHIIDYMTYDWLLTIDFKAQYALWATLCSLVLLQPCKVDSNSMISCLSHASSQSQLTSVQFFLNGVLYTGDSPSSFDSDEEEEEYQKGHFRLEYVEDPQFFTANKEKLIKHHPGEPLTLIINVSDTAETGSSD